MTAAIAWRNVSVRVGDSAILTGVDLSVSAGTWLALLGPNGAGKTTLVRTLGGTVAHDGDIEINGSSAAAMSVRQRSHEIAIVPQTPVIPPGITVFDYALLGRAPYQGLRLAASLEDRRRTFAVLQRLDLDHFGERAVTTLSGGERQRVVIARALVQDTAILALDEPTTSLDAGHQIDVLELIADLRSERPLTVVTTLHDLTMAGQFAQEIAVLAGGRVVAVGRPVDVLSTTTIAKHWGVDATVAADATGAVTVTVQRRRERSTNPKPIKGST